MTVIHQLLSSSAVEAWILSLMHSLWLGLLCVLLLWGVLKCLPARRSRLRYGVSCGILAVFVAGVLVTCSLLRMPVPSLADMPVAEAVDGREAMEMAAPPRPSVVVEKEVSATTASNVAVEARPRERQPWTAKGLPVLALAWFAGCLLMLLRTSRDLAAARSLAAGEELADPRLTAPLNDLCRRMRIRQSVRLKQTERLATVAVWGIFKPVILVPAGLVSNLRPDEVEAILAHELAHVRRRDLVVDLVQRLIEAVFFFNPAVWWISRQIRLEREACCDAVAAAVIQEPVRYAAILVDAAERMHASPRQPAVVMAMTGGSSGNLLDRVRRLLAPHSRPEMRLSWGTCLLLMLLVGLGLTLLQRGTDVAVALAAQILSHEERVELLAEQTQQSGAVTEKPDFDQVAISGEVLFGPGVPPTSRILWSALYQTLDEGGQIGLGELKEPTFQTTVPVGTNWLFFRGEGFAPAVLGPFEPLDGPTIENQKVLLSQGIEVPVEVVDADGNPAAGVRVGTTIMMDAGMGVGVGSAQTDNAGRAILQDVNADLEYNLTLSGAGYQEVRPFKGRLRSDEPVILSVQRSVPASGTIVDDDGESLEGVVIRKFITQRPGMVRGFGPIGDVLAMTDETGHFTLDRLEDGLTHHLLLEHPGYAPAILTNVRAGDEGLRAILSRGITVEVVVNDRTGELEEPVTVHWRQAPAVLGRWTEIARSRPSPRQREVWGRVTATRRDGTLAARIPRMNPGRLELTIDRQTETFDITVQEPQVNFDYSGPPAQESRPVVLSFHVDGKPVRPRGRLEVWGLGRTGSSPSRGQQRIPVEDGRLSFEVEPPTRVRADPEGLIGFWFSSHSVEWPQVRSGTEPVEIKIPVYPAGAVQGQVRRPDGTPAAVVDVSIVARLEISVEDSHDGRHRSYTAGQSAKTDADGKFFATPIPLGARYVVAVSESFYRQVSGEFEMSAEDVSPSHSITMHEQTTLAGQVLDPDGKPARGFPVSLHYEHPGASQHWGPPQLTDASGRFAFTGVNSKPTGTYTIAVKDRPGLQPMTVPLEIRGENLIRLKQGRTLSGRAVDPDGNPVPGVEVYVHFEKYQTPAGFPPFINADELTDAGGRFRFTTLPDRPMVLSARQLWNTNQPIVHPGQTKNVTIRGQIAPWHAERLKSSSPE